MIFKKGLYRRLTVACRGARRRDAFIRGFVRGGALFERIDLVDQLRFRLVKALLQGSGWMGHRASLCQPALPWRKLAGEDATTT